jgi:NAD(P)H-quinone oxidoreductase subunit 6
MKGSWDTNLAFVTLATLTVGSALLVVTLRNLVHAALMLGVSFIGVAGLYLLLNAEFIAAAQILVYVGAITVLILFAIMLTRGAATGPLPPSWNAITLGGVTALSFLLVLSLFIRRRAWPETYDPAGVADTTRVLWVQFMTTYLVPFEVASIVLLVALVAAIVLAQGEDTVSVPLKTGVIYDEGGQSPDARQQGSELPAGGPR